MKDYYVAMVIWAIALVAIFGPLVIAVAGL